jgi:putative ABC transport system permease protein
VLAAAGGAAGVLLAAWCRRALLGIAPESLGLGTDWAVGPRALLSAAAVTVAAALVSGLSPALRLSGGGLSRDLGDAGRSTSGGRRRHRLLGALVVTETAVSTALLAGAAFALVSFRNLSRVDPGFATRNTVSCLLATHDDGASIPRVIDALAALPGVESVGAANIDLLDELHSLPIRVTADDAAAVGGSSDAPALTVDYWIVTPGYFAAAGIPLLSGRTFEPRELEEGAAGVAVINEALARRLFSGSDALGRVVRIPNPRRKGEPGLPKVVVGVAASVKQRGLASADVPMLYVPDNKVGTGSIALVVRTRTDPAAVAAAVRRTVRAADPAAAVTRVSTTGQIVARSLAGRRFATALVSAFAALGVALVAVGLYGVMSYAVAQRTREIGVRMALGAARGAVIRLVLGEGMLLAGVGAAAGVVIACACARAAGGLLFGVSPADPATLAAVATLVCAVALAACAVPARRATRIEPLAALRHE